MHRKKILIKRIISLDIFNRRECWEILMPGLITIVTVDINTVLSVYKAWDPDVDGKYAYWDVNGEKWRTKMTSLRYAVFSKSITCVACGIQGTHFLLQAPADTKFKQAHFNLYGFNEAGEPVLFTKDHILPRSKGGKDNLDNLQTMCAPCNCKKGNTVSSQIEVNADELQGR